MATQYLLSQAAARQTLLVPNRIESAQTPSLICTGFSEYWYAASAPPGGGIKELVYMEENLR